MTLFRFLFPIVNYLARLLAIVTVTGTENVPRGGGVLLVSNHLTNYDALFLGMTIKRLPHFMAKTELYRNPVISWIIRHLGAFPVRRGEADRAALRQAEALLRGGRIVGIFPEGHRSRAAAMQAGQGGIALLARRSGVPILPVAITGSENLLPPAWPRWRPWRKPALTITYGRTFHLPETTGRPDYDKLTAIIMQHVAELLPPSYRGIYAGEIEEAED